MGRRRRRVFRTDPRIREVETRRDAVGQPFRGSVAAQHFDIVLAILQVLFGIYIPERRPHFDVGP